MKKFFIIFILVISAFCTFAQEFVFPPELNWWIDEIKKVEPSVIFDKFEFVEESFINVNFQLVFQLTSGESEREYSCHSSL